MNEEMQQCNIQGKEIKTRFWTGVFGIVFSFLFLISIFLFKDLNFIYGFFISAFIASIGFIQAREKYCVYVGIFDLLKDFQNHKKEILHILRSIGISLFISMILSLSILILILWFFNLILA